ncbi:hypothetical protein MKW98_029840 [Papaver atlanticum]|uniref:Endoglucanase n=1 Tax=Papaver atlanticum TaxID=357466 RepID=A0AAD4TGE8_9MAGN|nr:hypothetical protein MKW98_029840 [Papaver atlanticum]
MLRIYYDISAGNACSYLRQFDVFNYTRGGMVILNPGGRRHLQYLASTAFIASLFAAYLNAEKVPVWKCGPQYVNADELRNFSRSQMQYILGANPSSYSFLVGYGTRFPLHVHHRAASIPLDGHKYNCSSGRMWLTTPNPNPYNITGAMVGGPDSDDRFHDIRGLPDYTEPSLVGNAALVAALASISTSGGSTVDRNTMFQNVPPLNPVTPAPPAPWKPNI